MGGFCRGLRLERFVSMASHCFWMTGELARD